MSMPKNEKNVVLIKEYWLNNRKACKAGSDAALPAFFIS
jgi:hypothetical protein